jgi:hypothetical protein
MDVSRYILHLGTLAPLQFGCDFADLERLKLKICWFIYSRFQALEHFKSQAHRLI